MSEKKKYAAIKARLEFIAYVEVPDGKEGCLGSAEDLPEWVYGSIGKDIETLAKEHGLVKITPLHYGMDYIKTVEGE